VQNTLGYKGPAPYFEPATAGIIMLIVIHLLLRTHRAYCYAEHYTKSPV